MVDVLDNFMRSPVIMDLEAYWEFSIKVENVDEVLIQTNVLLFESITEKDERLNSKGIELLKNLELWKTPFLFSSLTSSRGRR
jgi:hypothetical protein